MTSSIMCRHRPFPPGVHVVHTVLKTANLRIFLSSDLIVSPSMAAEDKLHIVVFPWLAFGHMLPFLELSKSIAKLGHRISFVSTLRNIQRLPKLPPQLTSLIHLVPLTLPPTDGLPANAEATSDIPGNLAAYLKKAFDGLQSEFIKFMEEASPKVDWVIMDFAQWWLPKIGEEFGVPCVFFSVFIPALYNFFGLRWGIEPTEEELTTSPPWMPFPVAFRRHEAQWWIPVFRTDASGVSDGYRLKTVLEGCKALALRSSPEFESESLSLIQKTYGSKTRVIPVGLLAPPIWRHNSDTTNGDDDDLTDILNWLDKQAPRTVVYVAFGSEATLEAELMQELAIGLEISELPFLWALRKPSGLPEGFKDRTRGRGVIATGWIPQVRVLAHPAIGGFLTHCGWSSVIESLQYSIPLIQLPIFGDQGINSRVMKEKGIGVEVERDDDDGSFRREAVARAVRLVVVEDEGEPFRQKAKELREIFVDEKANEKYVEEFVQFLSNHKNGEEA